ncbi:hypothetical protein ACN47E_004237 [Coniothyrium glycines]
MDSLEQANDKAMTPPATPTRAGHLKCDSASSDLENTLSSLRRGDSISSDTSHLWFADSAGHASTELFLFPHHVIDYAYHSNAEGKRNRPIGEGLWSDVYLATPSISEPSRQGTETLCMTTITPPSTPVHSRESSMSKGTLSTLPFTYAIKVPASTSAREVLLAEARILSYLSRFPDAENHIVPFHGFDSRTGSLVLKAMDSTLESWIHSDLNTLDEASRAQRLATVFPTIALSLLHSLQWLQTKGCTHADIKPSNILVSRQPSPSSDLHPVFSDFSSSVLSRSDASIASEVAPTGAGTWDYLDPQLLTSSSPTPVSAASDLWSLAITLLVLVLGASPYDAFKGNKYQQREMIRQGAPMQCLAYDDAGLRNVRRLKTLSAHVGWDVQAWFTLVLVKEPGKRVGVAEWIGGLAERMG